MRIAEGKRGHRPLPEPVIVAGKYLTDLDCPEHLPHDAQEAWNKTVPALARVGIIDGVDSMALEMMTTAYARAKQAARVIASEGHFARGSTGQIREHPALAIERNAAATFLRYAEQYALTPVARTRLGLAEIERRKAQDELFDRLGPSNVSSG